MRRSKSFSPFLKAGLIVLPIVVAIFFLDYYFLPLLIPDFKHILHPFVDDSVIVLGALAAFFQVVGHYKSSEHSLENHTAIVQLLASSLQPSNQGNEATSISSTVQTTSSFASLVPSSLIDYFVNRERQLTSELESYRIAHREEAAARVQAENSLADAKRDIKLLKQNEINTQFRLIESLSSSEQWEEAIWAINRLLRRITHPHLLFIRARAYHSLNRIPDAVDDYTKVIKLKSDFAEAYNNRGSLLILQGKFGEAVQDLTVALNLKPDLAEAYNNRGNAYAGQGEIDKAIEDYNIAISLKVDFADPYNNLGAMLLIRNELASALAAIQKAIDIKPEFAAAYNNRGLALARQDQLDGAITNYLQAILADSGLKNAYRNLADAYEKKGKIVDAIETYSKVLSLEADQADIYYRRGNVYSKDGQFQEAIADYSQAIDLKHKFVEAYFNRAVAWSELGQFDKTISDYNKVLEFKPESAEAYNNRGNAYAAREKYEKAIKDYDKAISLNPDLAEPLQNRGDAYMRKRDFHTAIEYCTKAIALNPDFPEPYFTRGYSYFYVKRLDLALNDFEAYCRLRPKEAIAQNNRGYLLFRAEENIEAESAWRIATSLPDAPHYAFAGHAIVLKKLKKRKKQSVAQYRIAMKMDPRWKSNLEAVAGEYNWTPEMVRIARKILIKTID